VSDILRKSWRILRAGAAVALLAGSALVAWVPEAYAPEPAQLTAPAYGTGSDAAISQNPAINMPAGTVLLSRAWTSRPGVPPGTPCFWDPPPNGYWGPPQGIACGQGPYRRCMESC